MSADDPQKTTLTGKVEKKTWEGQANPLIPVCIANKRR